MKKAMSFLGGIALVTVVLFLQGTGNWIFSENVSAQEPIEGNIIRPVPAAMATPYQPQQTFRFPGKVKAAHRAELSFQIAGQIDQLNILEGQRVKRGTLLASLERKSHSYAVEAAKARFQAAKQDFARVSRLYREKVMSRAQFDAARAAADINHAELNMKEKELADTRLIAPFDGMVAKRYVEKKEHVDKGKPVLLLQDVSGIEVEVQLPEQLVARGGTDILDELQVCFDANPERSFAAKAMELSMESSQDTRTYALVIRLPSPEDMHILSGMTATVSGRIKQSTKDTANNHAVLVPVEAVAFAPNGEPYVWIVNSQAQKVEKRTVKIGRIHGDQIEVTQGLHAEELVATAGLYSLDEQQPVRPMKKGKEGLEG